MVDEGEVAPTAIKGDRLCEVEIADTNGAAIEHLCRSVTDAKFGRLVELSLLADVGHLVWRDGAIQSAQVPTLPMTKDQSIPKTSQC